MKRIAILGGGHGGYAAAVDLTLRGWEVSMFTFSAERVSYLKDRNNEIAYDGVWGQGACKVREITDDMEKAVREAELIIMAVPGPGHEKYLRELKPYMREDVILFMNPGHSGGALHAAQILRGRYQIAEANTLSYIARKKDESEVFVSSADKAVKVGVFPSEKTEAAIEKIREIYPNVKQARNVLDTTFSNINAMFHPPGVLLNAGWIEHTRGDFRFYYDGITESVGSVADCLDQERQMIARAYGLPSEDFSHALYEAGSTSKRGMESHSAYVACQESRVNQFIKAPESLNHRYMHEDISSGLVPMAELAGVADIPAPLMEALITVAGAMMGRDYRREGVNLDRMGIQGRNKEEIQEYVRKGY